METIQLMHRRMSKITSYLTQFKIRVSVLTAYRKLLEYSPRSPSVVIKSGWRLRYQCVRFQHFYWSDFQIYFNAVPKVKKTELVNCMYVFHSKIPKIANWLELKICKTLHRSGGNESTQKWRIFPMHSRKWKIRCKNLYEFKIFPFVLFFLHFSCEVSNLPSFVPTFHVIFLDNQLRGHLGYST